jgi:hypothetical protein
MLENNIKVFRELKVLMLFKTNYLIQAFPASNVLFTNKILLIKSRQNLLFSRKKLAGKPLKVCRSKLFRPGHVCQTPLLKKRT